MVKKKDVDLLIFDFDGTIVDSKSLYYEAMKKSLDSSRNSEKDIKKFIDMGLTIDKTLREMGFSKIGSWIMKIKIMRTIFKELNKISKCKNVSSLKKIDKRKIVISNSYKMFVNKVLKKLNLEKYFSEVHGAGEFEDKTEFIKEYLKKEGIDPKKVAYIGDRKVDIKLAKDVDCIGIIIMGKCAWDSKKEILEMGPDFIISSLEDLKDVF
ncbi:MAG: HAD family hydrolase [Minisyncoccales bacterium]